MPVRDARRADDLAGAAGEAPIQVQARRVAGRSALEHVEHQMDPAAWGFGLQPRDLIRRAGFEAHPAVDALAKAWLDLPQRRDRHVDEAVGTRPGARTPWGSKRCFSDRAIASGTRGRPHAPPTARLNSGVPRSTTRAPSAASRLARIRVNASGRFASRRNAMPLPG